MVRYVSGIRPTGDIHLGNYLGAIKPWKDLQEQKEDCLFFVADLHSAYGIGEAMKTFDQLVSLGIKTNNLRHESIYSEGILKVAHRLAQKTPVSWLNRMTQYKDKVSSGDRPTLSLFAYPVLMAADIFYFGGTHIPVGADQKQHIEFARDIQVHFPEFAKPEAVVMGYPRVMSLTDGTKKMSKSDPDDTSRINVTDDAAMIQKKIMAAKTSQNIGDNTPEANNLRSIYLALGGERIECFSQWSKFKTALADIIINELRK